LSTVQHVYVYTTSWIIRFGNFRGVLYPRIYSESLVSYTLRVVVVLDLFFSIVVRTVHKAEARYTHILEIDDDVAIPAQEGEKVKAREKTNIRHHDYIIQELLLLLLLYMI
jgi:hypothetical protein